MPWYDKYFTQQWQDFFLKQSAKKFHKHPHLIEDACQNAWLKLHQKLINNDNIVQTDAYIVTIFKRLLSDEFREHFGRCRAREWVKRLGQFWVKIAELLCVDNAPAEVIAEQVCCEQSNAEKNCLEEVQNIIAQLQKQDYCSQIGTREVPLSEHYEEPHPGHGPSDNMALNERNLLVNAILNVPANPEELQVTADHIIEQWQLLSTSLNQQLTDDDRLLLTRLHIEGHKLSQIARDLQIKEHKIRYQHNKIIATIKSNLQKHQINPDQF